MKFTKCAKTNRLSSRSARSTGWRILPTSRCTSSKCSPAAIWARTTSFGTKIAMTDAELPGGGRCVTLREGNSTSALFRPAKNHHAHPPLERRARQLQVEAMREAHDGVRGASANERAHHAAADRNEPREDRKSTRLNSSHSSISYAVFCLKKKKKQKK